MAWVTRGRWEVQCARNPQNPLIGRMGNRQITAKVLVNWGYFTFYVLDSLLLVFPRFTQLMLFSLLMFMPFFLMHWLSVSRWRCVWLFLRTWEKIFFPNFLGEDKPVKPALNGNFVKPGTPLCFIASGSKVPATQLWVILRKRLSYAIWEK